MAPDVTSAPPPSTPTLSIETLIPAVSVVIDGTEYAIRSRKQLSIIESTQVASWGERLIALVTRALAGEDALTPEEEAEAPRLLDRICRVVLRAPEEVHARLTDEDRSALWKLFSQLPSPPPLQATGAKTQRRARTTGASSRRGSSASTTPVTPPPGSPASRSAS
jgi:hypothetical protein